jgi:hypothetical protein
VAEEFEGADRKGASIGRQWRGLQDGADSWQVAAVLMRMTRGVFAIVRMFVIMRVRMTVIMIVRVGMVVRRVGILAVVIVGRVGFLTADEDAGLACADAAAIYGFKGEGCAEIEGGGGLLEERGRDACVDDGAEEHVSAEAGEAFEIANAHDDLL